MRYLDESIYAEAIKKHFSEPSMVANRQAGPQGEYKLGYFDIVRFFGDDAVDPGKVTIRHGEEMFCFRDQRIAEFAQEMAERLRAEGRLYDGPLATNLREACWDPPSPRMTVAPCRYEDQAGSCFALDWPHELFGEEKTLREYYLSHIESHSVVDNPLAICLGVCGILYAPSGPFPGMLIVQRSRKLASLEHSIGPSAAGSVDYDASDDTLLRLIIRSMSDEIEEELGLETGEYEIVPLAYGREIYRGERPQLFCLIKTDLPQEEINRRLDQKIEQKGEFERAAFAAFEEGRFPEGMERVVNPECQANLALVEEYWAAVK